MEIKVSDDKKPMTGTWYRSTIEPHVMGKVVRVFKIGNQSYAEVIFTGGHTDVCSMAEFADSWELS